jgi:hypothetical protein
LALFDELASFSEERLGAQRVTLRRLRGRCRGGAEQGGDQGQGRFDATVVRHRPMRADDVTCC